MKWIAVISFGLMCILPQLVYSQDVTVAAVAGKDTLLAGERVTITYKVEGGNISDFEAPDFTGFRILGGPNVSSSFSMLNGQVSQEASYSFVLQAIAVGDIEVQQAQITVDQKVYETEPIQIHVLENPDQELMDSLEEAPSSKNKFKKKRKTYKI